MDSVIGFNKAIPIKEEGYVGKFSDDDAVDDDEDGPLFKMGMTKVEKLVSRRPWKLSLISNWLKGV